MAAVRRLTFALPLHLKSRTNSRGHWARGYQRTKSERALIAAAWLKLGRPQIELPALVTFIRIAPRPLDDDNLRDACKALRDEVAKQLGSDDATTSPIRWQYEQLRGGAGEYSVRVEIIEVGLAGKKKEVTGDDAA